MPEPHQPLVAPSLLAGNHAALADSLCLIEGTSGVDWVHLDIMDGHFVPNLSFGPQTIKDLRDRSSLYFDVHLMLSRPDQYIDAFAKAGAQSITIHTEPDYPVAETLEAIRNKGLKCGIAINPDTPLEALQPYLDQVDLALLMTVQPGFGGQSFRESVLPKVQQLSLLRMQTKKAYRIQVDGGVDLSTGHACLKAGADTLVAGSAFFKADDRAAFVQHLSQPSA
jgi:ribulose-phosphate 3-epimerase